MTPLISLLTDFGPGSVYVGQMHAVLQRLAPESPVVDLAHTVPAGAVDAAAYMLGRSVQHFPKGSIHVAVVDPGVGTQRPILAGQGEGHFFIGPDNGLLARVLEGGEARKVENADLMAEEISNTFHGRDVMAPVAARLATDTPLANVGPRVQPEDLPSRLLIEDRAVTGHVLLADHFGNLITSIPGSLVEDMVGHHGGVRVRIGAAFIEGIVRTFADVASGRALAYVGSGGHLEIAVNEGRASATLGLGLGDAIRVEGKA